MNINMNEMSLDQLKVLAFDETRRFEQARQNVAILLQEVEKREAELVKPQAGSATQGG